jgi:hypothetical protein
MEYVIAVLLLVVIGLLLVVVTKFKPLIRLRRLLPEVGEFDSWPDEALSNEFRRLHGALSQAETQRRLYTETLHDNIQCLRDELLAEPPTATDNLNHKLPGALVRMQSKLDRLVGPPPVLWSGIVSVDVPKKPKPCKVPVKKVKKVRKAQ